MIIYHNSDSCDDGIELSTLLSDVECKIALVGRDANRSIETGEAQTRPTILEERHRLLRFKLSIARLQVIWNCERDLSLRR